MPLYITYVQQVCDESVKKSENFFTSTLTLVQSVFFSVFDHRIDFWMTWRSPQCHFDLYMTSKSVKVKGAKPPSRPNAQANGLFTPLLFIYFSVWNAWLASVRN